MHPGDRRLMEGPPLGGSQGGTAQGFRNIQQLRGKGTACKQNQKGKGKRDHLIGCCGTNEAVTINTWISDAVKRNIPERVPEGATLVTRCYRLLLLRQAEISQEQSIQKSQEGETEAQG